MLPPVSLWFSDRLFHSSLPFFLFCDASFSAARPESLEQALQTLGVVYFGIFKFVIYFTRKGLICSLRVVDLEVSTLIGDNRYRLSVSVIALDTVVRKNVS